MGLGGFGGFLGGWGCGFFSPGIAQNGADGNMIVIWGQVKIGGPEQAPGPHPFHTRVPYPRSIPP